ncbi:hypothetical protein [Vibrio phage BONAISHI]|nr:hypothetical protein [Vibrio phage BONAISHI]
MFLPQTEGVDHINIYTKSNTELGRILTNMYWMDPPVRMGHHGLFRTIEGWWYYVKITQLLGDKYWNDKREVLFDMQVGKGFEVKKIARKIISNIDPKKLKRWDHHKHKSMMLMAFQAKLNALPELQRLLKESTLPFDHYYVYGTGEKAIRREADERHAWQIAAWTKLREGLQ